MDLSVKIATGRRKMIDIISTPRIENAVLVRSSAASSAGALCGDVLGAFLDGAPGSSLPVTTIVNFKTRT